MAPTGGGDEAGESGGPPRHRGAYRTVAGAGAVQSLVVESESRKCKDAVISKEYLEVGCEDSQSIIKEIEDLRSQLDQDVQQLGYCEENEKLRVELVVKAKEMHCLTKRIEELEAKNDFLRKWSEELGAITDDLPKRNKELQGKNNDLMKQNKELHAKNNGLTKRNKELQARNHGLTKGNEELHAKNDDLHKNIMEIQTDAKRKNLLQFLGLHGTMDFPFPQVKSTDEEGSKIKASSIVAAGLSPSSTLVAQPSDAKTQIKALLSQLLSLTQQAVSADSIQAKDYELATKKEEVKSLFLTTKANLKAVSAEKETAEESLKVVQAQVEANKSGLSQALSDRDSALLVTGKMRGYITELMNEASIISASFILAVFKDHYPDLNMSVIKKGFKRDKVKARELLESCKNLAQQAVDQLEFSYSGGDDEESLSS